jgi:hypothetical protein
VYTLESIGNNPKSPSAVSETSSQRSDEPFVVAQTKAKTVAKKMPPPPKTGTSLDGNKPPARSADRFEANTEKGVQLNTPSSSMDDGTSKLVDNKKNSNYLNGPKKSLKFEALENETTHSPHYANLQTRDGDASSGFNDWLAYKIENAVAADANVRFYILFGISGFFCVVLALAWNYVTTANKNEETHDFWGAGNFHVLFSSQPL